VIVNAQEDTYSLLLGLDPFFHFISFALASLLLPLIAFFFRLLIVFFLKYTFSSVNFFLFLAVEDLQKLVGCFLQLQF